MYHVFIPWCTMLLYRGVPCFIPSCTMVLHHGVPRYIYTQQGRSQHSHQTPDTALCDLHWAENTLHLIMFSVHITIYPVQTLQNVQRHSILYTIYCILYTESCILYTVSSKLNIVYCILCTVYYSLHSQCCHNLPGVRFSQNPDIMRVRFPLKCG